MTVGQLVAALWTVPSQVEVNILFDRRLYDVSRVTVEKDLSDDTDRAIVLLRTGDHEERNEAERIGGEKE